MFRDEFLVKKKGSLMSAGLLIFLGEKAFEKGYETFLSLLLRI